MCIMAARIWIEIVATVRVFGTSEKFTGIFLQSLGKPVMSMVLSMLRDFILLVPLSLILPNLFELTGVLYSAPIADIVCFAVVLFLLFKINKDIKENKI